MGNLQQRGDESVTARLFKDPPARIDEYERDIGR